MADAGARGEIVLAQPALVADQQCGGGVGDLAGDRGGDPPAFGERRERTDLLPVGRARSLVGR
jgi:hypothetical protein